MSRPLTKRQSARVADLATEDELEQFAHWAFYQEVLYAMGDTAAVDAIARDARRLAYKILQRGVTKITRPPEQVAGAVSER